MTPIQTSITEPVKVLAIYRTHKRGFYIETHPVVSGKVMSGKPARPETLREIAKVILKKDVNHRITYNGINARNLLAFSLNNGQKKALWFVPSQQRTMFFTPDLKIPSGKAWQPDLLFFLDERSLSVFAIKEKTISGTTKLFVPPYHNLASDGYVCLGKIRPKDFNSLDETMAHWEELFYNSYFSHAGGVHEKLSFNINKFWTDLIKSQAHFPEDALVPAEEAKTVDHLLSYFKTLE